MHQSATPETLAARATRITEAQLSHSTDHCRRQSLIQQPIQQSPRGMFFGLPNRVLLGRPARAWTNNCAHFFGDKLGTVLDRGLGYALVPCERPSQEGERSLLPEAPAAVTGGPPT